MGPRVRAMGVWEGEDFSEATFLSLVNRHHLGEVSGKGKPQRSMC